ncbi:MAG: NADP-dependent malic enzyme [bacterium]|nr:NADP-dependent malic enzyme [bacterium]
MSEDIKDQAIEYHRAHAGKIHTSLNAPLETKLDLSLAYTPGVAAVSTLLQQDPSLTNSHTWRGRTVAVISDGSSVLGLGNIGPDGAYPVMEGKCALFTRFAGLNAVPILIDTQDPEEVIRVVEAIAPSFGAINLEDIAAPNCFYIEEVLKKSLSIPVVHDDQWGTAIVVLAGLINACKVVDKDLQKAKVVINGVGAAGASIIKILNKYGVVNISACDSRGILYQGRVGNDQYKELVAKMTTSEHKQGKLEDVVTGADILIGVSRAGMFSTEMIRAMSKNAIVFALANPSPEILPDEAIGAGAAIMATGRSDYPNQVNNALAFPGLFKGALENGVTNITMEILIKAAVALAGLIPSPTTNQIIPSIFDASVVETVAASVRD